VNASKERDQQLHETYQGVVKVLATDEIRQLRGAQHLWLQFRDTTCNAERDMYQGGSAASMVYYACLEAETRYRIKDLKDTYEWRIEKSR